jgi:hypothetical protein
MRARITATELGRRLADILSRVQYRGDEFLIERNGVAVGVLGPAPSPGYSWHELFDLVASLRTGDPSFANDLEAIHGSQAEPQVRDWPD